MTLRDFLVLVKKRQKSKGILLNKHEIEQYWICLQHCYESDYYFNFIASSINFGISVLSNIPENDSDFGPNA